MKLRQTDLEAGKSTKFLFLFIHLFVLKSMIHEVKQSSPQPAGISFIFWNKNLWSSQMWPGPEYS